MTATTATAKALAYAANAHRAYLNPRVIAVAEAGGHELALLEADYTYTYNHSTGEKRTTTTRVLVDETGRTSTGVKGDVKAATRKLERYVAERAHDDQLRPTLTGLIRNSPRGEVLVPATDLTVGAVVYVHALGQFRRGQLIKVAKTNATVAYTTASSGGRIFRKAVPFAQVLTPGTIEEVRELVAAAPATSPVQRLRHHVTGAVERGEAEPVVEVPAVDAELAAGLGSLRAQLVERFRAEGHDYGTAAQLADSSDTLRVAKAELEAGSTAQLVHRLTTSCRMTDRQSRDGRRYCACGALSNPAGFCTETGRRIGVDGWRALTGVVAAGVLAADARVTVTNYSAGPVRVPAGVRVTLTPTGGSDGTVHVNAADGETYAGGGCYGTARLVDLELTAALVPAL